MGNNPIDPAFIPSMSPCINCGELIPFSMACQTCENSLSDSDLAYLLGYLGDDYLYTLCAKEAYEEGVFDRKGEELGFDCTCNPMGWNTEKDCPLHGEDDDE